MNFAFFCLRRHWEDYLPTPRRQNVDIWLTTHPPLLVYVVKVWPQREINGVTFESLIFSPVELKSHNYIVNDVCVFNKLLKNGLFHNHVHDMAPNSFWMAEKLKIVWQSRWLHYDGNHVGLNGCSTYDETIAIEEFHLLGNRSFLFITLSKCFQVPHPPTLGHI